MIDDLLEKDIMLSAEELADQEADSIAGFTHYIFKEGFIKGFKRGVNFILCRLKLAESDEELIKGKAYVLTDKQKRGEWG